MYLHRQLLSCTTHTVLVLTSYEIEITMSIELSVDAVIPQQPAPAAEQTMQVQMPANALPGSIVQFMGPGGNKVEIVVPPYAIPGTVLTIEVPGAVPAPAAPAVADPAYSAGSH